MSLSECYRVLGLQADASFEEVKTSYRRLVRRYHPDVNPNNRVWAKEKFIELTEAYKRLTAALTASSGHQTLASGSQTSPGESRSSAPSQPPSPRRNGAKPVTIRPNPALSEVDNQLKQQTYQRLQEFLKEQRFPRAIALIEGLAQRIPNDLEVKQWQAITYQRAARHLAVQHQYAKAKIYLKKALRVDPHNRKLWLDIKRDFDQLEQVLQRQV